MRIRITSMLLAACFAMTGANGAAPAVPSVTVQGILQSGEFLGPPKFGESPGSDRVETAYYLQLPAPLVVQVHPAGALSGFGEQSQSASFVQLVVFDEEQSVARALVGKRIRVVGTVMEADANHRKTPALIQVKSLAAIRDWQW